MINPVEKFRAGLHLGRVVSIALCGLVGHVGMRSTAYAQLPPRPPSETSAAPEGPALFVDTRFKEMGTVPEGEVLTVTWVLENRGHEDLLIERTATSCGCTVVALTEAEKRIAPGTSRTLKATFNSTGRRGDQTKTVTVYSNDPAEPQLKLEFHVHVEPLYDVLPPGIVNLHMVQRGQPIQKTVELLPARGRRTIEIQEITAEEGVPLEFSHEPFSVDGATAQRIHLRVAEDVPLGPVNARARVRFTVDGLPREHIISMRGEVVGDLIWRPRVLDMTRRPVSAGRKLSPVIIESTTKTPFKILEATAGPMFDVTIDRKKPTMSSVILTLREDAPPGPFAVTLRARTDSLDQPLVSVPVFGIVAEQVIAEPPLILLRADGSKVGTHRRVKIRPYAPTVRFRITSVSCDSPYVEVSATSLKADESKGMYVLEAVLTGQPNTGRHEATVVIKTDAPEIGEIRLPVVVDAPG